MTTEAIEEQRREIYEVAEAIAPSWERRRAEIEAVSAPVREWMLRELSLRPGATLLELAAGVGDTGFEAAAQIGERGRLISTDFSPAMLAAAQRRGAERGVENVEYRLIDAERIDLPDDTIDAVLCRFGYMLMSDPASALAETRRVLRPGGRVSLAVWGALERNPFFTVVATALTQLGHLPPPEPSGPPVFSLGSPEGTRVLLERAGFSSVRTEEVPVLFELAGVDEYLGLVGDTAGPLGLVLRGISGADRVAVNAEVMGALPAFAVGRGYALPGLALCAAAG